MRGHRAPLSGLGFNGGITTNGKPLLAALFILSVFLVSCASTPETRPTRAPKAEVVIAPKPAKAVQAKKPAKDLKGSRVVPSDTGTEAIDSVFWALKQQLVASGLKKAEVDRAFKGVKYVPGTILTRLLTRETRQLYRGFLTKRSVNRTYAFVVKHEKIFQKARKEYGVPPEIIGAILMIETRLGAFQGRYNVMNVLATLASTRGALGVKDVRSWLDKQKQMLYPETRLKKWLNRKNAWAFRELRAAIVYAKKNKLDVRRLKGSFAAALGIPQFLPSNALVLGVDGNKDGKVLLHHLDDAVMSAAKYLKHHGWRPGLCDASREAVIRRYNNSRPYAQAVLKLAALVRAKLNKNQKRGRKGAAPPRRR